MSKKTLIGKNRVAKSMIQDITAFWEKDILCKILHNQELTLIWAFTKCGNIKKKRLLVGKIEIMNYKTW